MTNNNQLIPEEQRQKDIEAGFDGNGAIITDWDFSLKIKALHFQKVKCFFIFHQRKKVETEDFSFSGKPSNTGFIV